MDETEIEHAISRLKSAIDSSVRRIIADSEIWLLARKLADRETGNSSEVDSINTLLALGFELVVFDKLFYAVTSKPQGWLRGGDGGYHTIFSSGYQEPRLIQFYSAEPGEVDAYISLTSMEKL